MKKIDIVGIAFGNFKRRKTRSILTVSGVVIGVSSIVVMISLGIAVNVTFQESMKNMGDLTTIGVYPGYDEATGQQKGNLNDELIAEIRTIPNVLAVSPEIQLGGKLASGKYVNYANVIGIDTSIIDELGFKMESGTTTDLVSDNLRNIKVIVGSEVPYGFYNPRDRNSSGGGMVFSGGMMGGMGGGETTEREPPTVDLTAPDAKLKYTFDYSYGEKKQPGMGNEVVKKPTLYKMTPTGFLSPTSGEKDRNVYIDMETAKKLKAEQTKYNNQGRGSGGNATKKEAFKYDSIKVIVSDVDSVKSVTEAIREKGYGAWGNGETAGELQQLAGVLQLILGGIGSISLLVAAIGITNTMIMSIYERTKEIGIMKVIGCQLKDIKAMFLYEAAFIGLFGGAAGLIISYGLSAVLNFVGKGGGEGGMGFLGIGAGAKLSIIPPWLALLSVVFAIMVGLISGFLPARRAMKLSALEAMRN